jgi:hypothetical protein
MSSWLAVIQLRRGGAQGIRPFKEQKQTWYISVALFPRSLQVGRAAGFNHFKMKVGAHIRWL